MIGQRIMRDEEREELENDIRALKFAIYIVAIIFWIFFIPFLWIQNLPEIELYGCIIGITPVSIILIIGGNWEVKGIRKDIENGVVEVISGNVTKDTKLYKNRKCETEIDHEIVNLKRPVYIKWLKKGNIIEIIRAPISTNICKVVVNGDIVYPFNAQNDDTTSSS